MYIINNFLYGHQFSLNQNVNNDLYELDFQFQKEINGKTFEVSFPYHGSATTQPIFFGCLITSDDLNSNFANEIRSAKEMDYKLDYDQFVELCIEELNNIKSNVSSDCSNEELEEIDSFVKNIINFLNSTNPSFYIVESSS